VWICCVEPNSVVLILLTVHRTGIELYTSLMTFKTFSIIFSGLRYMIDLFATVMHVPQIVCVYYSTVNIGKCKQQVTERLLHMIGGGGGSVTLAALPAVYSPARCVLCLTLKSYLLLYLL
jgi:hypothetical protein